MVKKYISYKINVRYAGVWREFGAPMSYTRKQRALAQAKRLRKMEYVEAVHVLRKTTVFETVAKL